jgi:hypothetical protein
MVALSSTLLILLEELGIFQGHIHGLYNHPRFKTATWNQSNPTCKLCDANIHDEQRVLSNCVIPM